MSTMSSRVASSVACCARSCSLEEATRLVVRPKSVMSCEKLMPPPARVKRRDAESEPEETRLAWFASCAVSEAVSVGSSAERDWRTTWCCASASRWLMLARGLLASAMRSASSRVSVDPGAAGRADVAGDGGKSGGLEDDGASVCPKLGDIAKDNKTMLEAIQERRIRYTSLAVAAATWPSRRPWISR